MGTIYKRGRVYWIKYYRAGKPYRESAKSKNEKKAIDLLKLREGEIVQGRFPGLKVEKVRYEELKEDLLNDYKVNGKKSLGRLERSLKHLDDFFKGFRVIALRRIKPEATSSSAKRKAQRMQQSTGSWQPSRGC